MDPGRYGVQHGWENNSALDRYPALHEPNFRAGDSYDDRRYLDDREIYSRNEFPQPEVGVWSSQTRRRSYEDEYPPERDSRRHDPYPEGGKYREVDFDSSYKEYSVDRYDDHGYERPPRYGRERDEYSYDDYEYRSRVSQSREDSRERDYEYGRHSFESDYDRGGRREGSWRRRESRDRKGLSREREQSPYRKHERSRSRGHDERVRSRSPRSRSHGRSHREDSYDDDRYDRMDRRRDRDYHSVVPSATVVVKGLSQKTTEEDLYQMLAEWGPLRHVRVIKERNSGVSRGFAFIDFPSTGSARSMMEKLGDEGLVVDGRKLFFEYSKPTGGPFGSDGSSRSGHMNHRSTTLISDWMCTICGCVNFARRTSCFQCNEPRTDDAPPADMASSNSTSLGPTHVLVVRGLDENSDEEMLRYEFSKHAPIKDLRLVRDKFTHVSRGFAFVHFHSVEDATKALEATNGTTLEKNGQILRVAYAKSILGPGAGASSHSSSLAAAAIEAATFSQQYDAVGWAPKEYNPDEKQSNGVQDQSGDKKDGSGSGSGPQSGFVWDEASGYYYDAASGFYYDGNTGLYYDGNNGIWYSYDQQTQQYVPCNDQNEKTKENEPSKTCDGSNTRKVVISAPAATVSDKTTTSLADAVQAAAAAAIAAEKKEKEKMKEIRLASKSSILASKKKMSNVLSMWKQRSHESQAPRVALDGNQVEEKEKEKEKPNPVGSKGKTVNISPVSVNTSGLEIQDAARSGSNISGGGLRGVIRGSGRGVVKSDTTYTTETNNSGVPFRTDASALGAYTPPAASASGKRRFSEAPAQSVSSGYRDRAAERRSLYGWSSGGDDIGAGDSNGESAMKRDSMPFPPGVGGRGAGEAGGNGQSYEVITAEKAIDESNVGNRMLRNMGWQEGLGLGKDGSGMVEPVQAQATEKRAGLGSHQPKKMDPSLEVQAGDSYRTLIQKKALARFREMS